MWLDCIDQKAFDSLYQIMLNAVVDEYVTSSGYTSRYGDGETCNRRGVPLTILRSHAILEPLQSGLLPVPRLLRLLTRSSPCSFPYFLGTFTYYLTFSQHCAGHKGIEFCFASKNYYKSVSK